MLLNTSLILNYTILKALKFCSTAGKQTATSFKIDTSQFCLDLYTTRALCNVYLASALPR